MNQGVYILGALFLGVLASLAYFIATLAGARRRREALYEGPVPEMQPDVEARPMVTGDWQPSSPAGSSKSARVAVSASPPPGPPEPPPIAGADVDLSAVPPVIPAVLLELTPNPAVPAPAPTPAPPPVVAAPRAPAPGAAPTPVTQAPLAPAPPGSVTPAPALAPVPRPAPPMPVPAATSPAASLPPPMPAAEPAPSRPLAEPPNAPTEPRPQVRLSPSAQPPASLPSEASGAPAAATTGLGLGQPAAPPPPPPPVPPEDSDDTAVPLAFKPLSDVNVVPEPPAPDRIPKFTPVGPVDIRFDDRRSPVGVKPGSRTYEEFQKAAAALFAELRRSKPQ